MSRTLKFKIEIMPEIKAIWKGNLALSNIVWGNSTLPEYKLDSKLDSEVSSYWEKYLSERPNDYDGTLLFLYDFEFNNSCLKLNMGTIKFSTIVFMDNLNLKVNKDLGMLGVQCLIFNNRYSLYRGGFYEKEKWKKSKKNY